LSRPDIRGLPIALLVALMLGFLGPEPLKIMVDFNILGIIGY